MSPSNVKKKRKKEQPKAAILGIRISLGNYRSNPYIVLELITWLLSTYNYLSSHYGYYITNAIPLIFYLSCVLKINKITKPCIYSLIKETVEIRSYAEQHINTLITFSRHA